jgi:uncharacterized coiled-coil protein SlyX
LQNKINELQNKINELQNKINALETSITGLTQTVTEHAQQINELDSDINGIEDRVADLEQNPPSSEPTVGESVKIEDLVNGSYGIVVCENDTTLYRTKVQIDADGNIKALNTVEAKHYYKKSENE